MITVIAEIQINAGTEAFNTVLEAFRKVTPLVLNESGCFGYELYMNHKTQAPFQIHAPNSILMFERWESLEHLQQHMQTPHMLEFQNMVKHAVKETQIRIMQLGLMNN